MSEINELVEKIIDVILNVKKEQQNLGDWFDVDTAKTKIRKLLQRQPDIRKSLIGEFVNTDELQVGMPDKSSEVESKPRQVIRKSPIVDDERIDGFSRVELFRNIVELMSDLEMGEPYLWDVFCKPLGAIRKLLQGKQ